MTADVRWPQRWKSTLCLLTLLAVEMMDVLEFVLRMMLSDFLGLVGRSFRALVTCPPLGQTLHGARPAF